MDDVKNNFPELVDHYAESTQIGVDDIINNLCHALGKRRKAGLRKQRKQWINFMLFMIAITSLFAYTKQKTKIESPSKTEINNLIQRRIANFQSDLDTKFKEAVKHHKGQRIGIETLLDDYANFGKNAKQEHTAYSFSNDYITLAEKKSIEAFGFPAFESPDAKYGMTWPDVYKLATEHTAQLKRYRFVVKEPKRVLFKIIDNKRVADTIMVYVSYTHPLRVVYGDLVFTKLTHKKTQQISMHGFKPIEKYSLTYSQNQWRIKDVE